MSGHLVLRHELLIGGIALQQLDRVAQPSMDQMKLSRTSLLDTAIFLANVFSSSLMFFLTGNTFQRQ